MKNLTGTELMAVAALVVAIVGIVVAIAFSKEPSSEQISTAIRDYCAQDSEPCRSSTPGPATELPAGLVVAFPEKCPDDGWEKYVDGAGRFILGAGNANGENEDENGDSLSARLAGQFGGTEEHLLTTREMPSHSHTYHHAKHVFRDRGDKGAAQMPGRSSPTESSGGGEAHNNMPPFIVMQLCIKT